MAATMTSSASSNVRAAAAAERRRGGESPGFSSTSTSILEEEDRRKGKVVGLGADNPLIRRRTVPLTSMLLRFATAPGIARAREAMNSTHRVVKCYDLVEDALLALIHGSEPPASRSDDTRCVPARRTPPR